MIYETIDLYEQLRLPRGGEKGGRVTSFRHADLTEMGQKHIRPALLIIPGGGYGMISQREAEPVAARYFAEGFDCFVLDYAVAPACYPTQRAGVFFGEDRRRRLFGGRAPCGVRELSLA